MDEPDLGESLSNGDKEKRQNFHKVEKTKQKNDLNCINLCSAATESGDKGQFTKFKPSDRCNYWQE